MARSIPILLCALSAVMPCGQALAVTRAALLVYPAPVATQRTRPPAPPAVARELRQALLERDVKAPEGAIEKALRAHAEQQTGALLLRQGAVRELLSEGRRRLARVELEQAEAILQDAVDRGQGLLGLSGGVGLYAELLRWHGVALFELRRLPEASREFRRALTILPAVGLTAADVRPDVVAAFRRVREGLSGKVPLTVVPRLLNPAGDAMIAVPRALLPAVTITIDGADVPLGREGGRTQEVVPGEHVVTVHVPGYLSRVLLLPVAAEGGLELIVTLSPDRTEAALLQLLRAPAPAGLGALCAALALDSVLVASAGSDAEEVVLVGQRFHCGPRAPSAAQLARGAAAAPLSAPAEQLVGRLWQPGERAPAPVPGTALSVLSHPVLLHPREPRTPPRHTPFWRRPWIWLGALAVTSGVVLGLSLMPRPEPRTTVVVDPGSFSLTARPLLRF